MTKKLINEQFGQYLDWQLADLNSPSKLNGREIHLWCIKLSLNAAHTEVALSLLNDIQRDKYHRRRTAEKQESYLASRYYLLNLLAAYSDTKCSELCLSYSHLNKPYLNPNPSRLEFNFTDTIINQESIGLFAFCRSVSIGVDIESLSRKCNFAAIDDKRFSAAESKYVRDDSGNIIPERVLSIWTRKEAYGKAIGKGINFNMSEVDLASPNSFELDFSTSDQPKSTFRMLQIQLNQNAIASLVYENHHPLTIQAFKLANHIP